MNVDYSVNNLLVISKSGYQKETQVLNYVNGEHQYDLIMYPVVSVISTSKGHAVSLQPNSRTNKHFN